MQIWSEAELEFLRKNISKATTKEIYDVFVLEFGEERSYNSVQKKVQALRVAYSTGDSEPAQDLDVEETILIPYGDDVVSIPLATRSNLRSDRKQWLKDFVEYSKQHKPGDVSIKPVATKDSSLVVALSDLHFGQQNKGYDIQIAEKRIGEMPDRLMQAVGMVDIDEVVYLMIGDMVEGEDIYPSQPHHIVCSTMEQVEHATIALWNMIRRTQKLFKVPVRVVCVFGNHGKANAFNSEKTNWDNVLYHSLKIVAHECADPNIGIECDYSEFKTFMVKDQKGMIYHQGVKHNGTPAMREKIAGWVYAKQFNFMVSGHWHEWKVGCWAEAMWMANGSLCGPNDLSERIAQEGPARQGYFLVTAGKPLWGFGYIEFRNEVDNAVPFNTKELK